MSLRAPGKRIIDERIDDLVAASDRSRAMREAAAAYQGQWRDVVLFLCAVLFTVIWWNINHNRTNWLPMFIVLIIVSILTAGYALRGVLRAAATLIRRQRRDQIEHELESAEPLSGNRMSDLATLVS